ncbi:hypothetical protein BC936DRAFT_137955 [Jimgerdemannia flammicorona]|uniref:Uncharacterized protein n=1 Tax=Jimgerdemannia flammicorona TaxID=994334 RepID=A0A433CW65_9FUNG|nr:hypothetical protein BC936DRAFT_137955 [Jimgerdemannia flammicorona]
MCVLHFAQVWFTAYQALHFSRSLRGPGRADPRGSGIGTTVIQLARLAKLLFNSTCSFLLNAKLECRSY